MEYLRVKDLDDGTYAIASYESRQNKFGKSFVIEAINESGQVIMFWSNSYLAQYLIERQPKHKFNITIKQNNISINNYSRKIVLQ